YARYDFVGGMQTEWPAGGANIMVQLHAGDVYFINRNLGDIYKAPADGSAAPMLHLNLANTVKAFAIDASGLYYFDCSSWLNGTLHHSALDGSNVIEVTPNVNCPETLTMDGDALYLHGTYELEVQRIGKLGKPDAGTVTTIAT